jgi:nitrogen permease regulator 2-like protein
LTRPTIISNERYERNSLLFSVGFVLRRETDIRPFRPILSKFALTLRGTCTYI